MTSLARLAIASLLFFCLAADGCRAEPQRAAPGPAQRVAVDAIPPEKSGGFDGSKAFAHVERLVSIGPRAPGSEGIRRAREYIRTQLAGYGCPVEEDSFRASTPIGDLPMKNLLVKIPGKSPSVVLLMTHYDTKAIPDFVGANDGGSSTGLMLELARLLCVRKNALTVWIGFLDGEEALVEWTDTDSTYGSRQLAASLALSGDLKRVKAVLLADLIGDKDLDIRRDSNSTRWLTDLVWSTASRLGYGKYFLPEQTAIKDDHLPFLRRGVPAVDIIDFDYAPWHTPTDTLDKISPRSLSIVGHVLLEVLAQLEKRFD